MDKVVHFEIPFDDAERAKAFYAETFGWQIMSMPEMGYHLCTTVELDENRMPKEPGAINGGMMSREYGLKNPVIVINVDDINDALSRVRNQGGAVVREPIEVAEMGWAAYFTDPEGNVLGLWQSR